MITVEAIRTAVAREFRVPSAYLVEPRPTGKVMDCPRNPYEVSHPRQVAMALSYLLTDQSQHLIGKHFGGRDHTTVVHARRAVEKRRVADPKLNAALQRLTLDLIRTGAGI